MVKKTTSPFLYKQGRNSVQQQSGNGTHPWPIMSRAQMPIKTVPTPQDKNLTCHLRMALRLWSHFSLSSEPNFQQYIPKHKCTFLILDHAVRAVLCLGQYSSPWVAHRENCLVLKKLSAQSRAGLRTGRGCAWICCKGEGLGLETNLSSRVLVSTLPFIVPPFVFQFV